jgi:hypothetical protein
MPVQYVGASSAGDWIEFTVTTATQGSRGIAAIYSTAASTSTVELSVNGVLQRTFSSILSGSRRLIFIDYECTNLGDNVIRITKVSPGGSLYVIGVNFSTLEENQTTDVDSMAWGDYGVDYVVGTGANDYALFSANTNKWFGSYHGGETANFAPVFYIDSVNTSIPDVGAFAVCEHFRIVQQTTIADGAGGSLGVYSTYIYSVDGAQTLDVAMQGSAALSLFYTAMTCSSSDFTRISYPALVSPIATGGNRLGRYNKVTQENLLRPGAQISMTTSFTLFPLGGPNGAQMQANGVMVTLDESKAKVYYGPVSGSLANIEKIGFSTTRVFE